MDKLSLPNDGCDAVKEAAHAHRQIPADCLGKKLPSKPVKKFVKSKSSAKKAAKPKSMADVLAEFIGSVKSTQKLTLSENGRDEFTDYLEEKQKAGHL